MLLIFFFFLQYSFSVAVRDNEGSSLAIPVRVTVVVEDINDNPPVCQKAVTKFEVQENEGVGKKALNLSHNAWLRGSNALIL